MKVYIGPYRNWIGPYQIAEALMFWSKNEDLKHRFGEWLDRDKNDEPSNLNRFCNWIHEKRKRKIKVRIDREDTWNMDNTLAYIVLPMLKQLKETKHGSPYTDDEDVPEHLRSTVGPSRENEWDTDEKHYARWDWIMNEMIYAFEMELNDEWEVQIWQRGGEDWTDEKLDERNAIQKRIENGFRLFGKYYQALWD
jgi:hypothetical protein